jgi:hypothetical protein
MNKNVFFGRSIFEPSPHRHLCTHIEHIRAGQTLAGSIHVGTTAQADVPMTTAISLSPFFYRSASIKQV